MQYAYVAAQEAIEQSGIAPFEPLRTGIVMGTALEGLALTGTTQESLTKGARHVSPKFLTKYMGNIAALHSLSYPGAQLNGHNRLFFRR